MKVSVTRTTEVIGGKEYPLTVTRQIGAQEIGAGGTPVRAVELTVFESPLGQSRCCTRAQPAPTSEERAAGLERVRETAVRAMLEQGIW